VSGDPTRTRPSIIHISSTFFIHPSPERNHARQRLTYSTSEWFDYLIATQEEHHSTNACTRRPELKRAKKYLPILLHGTSVRIIFLITYIRGRRHNAELGGYRSQSFKSRKSHYCERLSAASSHQGQQ
jgi:hypothetical protein